MLAYFHESNEQINIDTESLIENNQERQLLADIHTRELEVDDPVTLINACISTLKKMSLNKKKSVLLKIQKTDRDDPKLIELMQKIKQINKELSDTQNLDSIDPSLIMAQKQTKRRPARLQKKLVKKAPRAKAPKDSQKSSHKKPAAKKLRLEKLRQKSSQKATKKSSQERWLKSSQES